MLRKTNVIWHATKYIQRQVLIRNDQMAKDLEIHSLEEYTHIFLIYVLWNTCKSFAPKQTECTAQGMEHPPKWTDQMEQLVYFAASVCSRPTIVGRR